MKKAVEILVTILAFLTPILLLDAVVFLHPADATLWRGTHNFLGRWISWPHLRVAELAVGGLGVLTVAVLLIGSFVRRGRTEN